MPPTSPRLYSAAAIPTTLRPEAHKKTRIGKEQNEIIGNNIYLRAVTPNNKSYTVIAKRIRNAYNYLRGFPLYYKVEYEEPFSADDLQAVQKLLEREKETDYFGFLNLDTGEFE